MALRKRRLNILVFGAGAVGSVLGGFLSRRHSVTLLGRPGHMTAIRKSGLRVSGIWGSRLFSKLRVISDQKELLNPRRSFDLILVTVKSYDTLPAAKIIRFLTHPETLVVSLQNGLGNIEALQKHIPSKQILAGRVIFGAELLARGKVKVTVMAAPVALGETKTGQGMLRVKQLALEFKRAGVPAVAAKDVTALLWLKVIYNCALNPLASILECHYGKLSETYLTRLMMNKVIEEIYRVAGKAKIKLEPSTPEKYGALFYSELLPRTYLHRPSMLQDLERGKRTEIESLNGLIVRLGKKHGIKTPINEELARLIRRKEKSMLLLKRSRNESKKKRVSHDPRS